MLLFLSRPTRKQEAVICCCACAKERHGPAPADYWLLCLHWIALPTAEHLILTELVVSIPSSLLRFSGDFQQAEVLFRTQKFHRNQYDFTGKMQGTRKFSRIPDRP